MLRRMGLAGGLATLAPIAGCVAQLDDWDPAGDVQPTGLQEGVVSEPLGPSAAAGSTPPTSTSSSSGPTHGSETPPGSWSVPASCKNGVWDSGETDVDCGGLTCPACAQGWACEVDDDCQTRLCAGVCLALSCGNGVSDATETDIDCGGPCKPCTAAAGCAHASDCESGVCVAGTCGTAACDDGQHNGSESDVDCGGSAACAPCDEGRRCSQATDCRSGVCSAGACVRPECTDGAKNGLETDVDCGGPNCSACAGDKQCVVAADCTSELCLELSPGVRRCSAAACDDGTRNGRETALDCGGPDCRPCDDGASCLARTNCISSVCDRVSRTCATATCTDSTLNGEETGVDCGGPCEPCAEGGLCRSDRDCLSNVCAEGTCRAASCFDGERNQSESDVDCGGECAGCGVGAACETSNDCRSGACSDVCLPGQAGRPCGGDAECRSGSCSEGICDGAAAGASCTADDQCITLQCAGSICAKGGWNAPCNVDDDCATGRCEVHRCSPSRFVIETEGGTDTSIVDFKARISASDADPARQWRDLALLYFFTAEAHDDFVSRYYAGPDFDVWDARFLARSFDGRDWAMIWRAAATNTTVAPSTVSTIVYQVRNDPWATFILTNDHSYRAGFGPNGKVVVCQRLGGRWIHTQGIPPTAFPDPCGLVVDTCNGAAGICDPLMRTQ